MRIAIVDTSGFFHRSYYALPKLKSASNQETGVLTGFMNFIFNLNRDFEVDRIIFALDREKKNFRHDLYSEYKSNRLQGDAELKEQIKIATAWISQMGFCTASQKNYEADDVIASLAEQFKDEHEVIILSHDKDFNQLIDESVKLYDSTSKTFIDKEGCFEKYKVYPFQFIDYQAIVGDSIDNVHGVKGAGKVTASKLLNQFSTLEGIYNNLESLSLKDKEKFSNNREDAFLSKKLVTLDRKCFRLDSLDSAKFPSINPIYAIFDELVALDMKAIIQRTLDKGLAFETILPKGFDKIEKLGKELIDNKGKKSGDFDAILIDSSEQLQAVLQSIPKDALLAFDTETDSLDSSSANIIGFSFCLNEVEAYYIPLANETFEDQIEFDEAKEFIKQLVKKTDKFIYQNYKYDSEVIYNNFRIKLPLFHDTLILAWLFEQNNRYSLDKQVLDSFGKRMVEFKSLVNVNKGETFADVELAKASYYASEDAFYTFALFQQYKKKATGERAYIFEYAQKYEYPFIEFVIELESRGIATDRAYLYDLQAEFEDRLLELVNKIHTISGYEFNINSSTQLSKVLYEHLKISTKGVKKTSTGYSTSEEYLSSKVNEHEVIAYVLEYKKDFKLYSTYITPLINRLQEEDSDIIRANFSQTGTTTGRLSSSNPNLQNIPVRTEDGKRIRNAFVAREGYQLVSFDYSQIELRLLAHFSQDVQMIQAYKRGADIHLETAIKLFGSEEAQSKRAIAKSINFGIIYGMGARKLSQEVNISQNEAKKYIEQYFATYPTVRKYLHTLGVDAEKDGYIQTLLGRKQWFDLKNTKNREQYLHLLREAVNSKFQGSASDILKLASINITKQIREKSDIFTLVQIHDELLFEIKKEAVEEYATMIIESMQSVLQLNVPLEVSYGVAKRWGELKD